MKIWLRTHTYESCSWMYVWDNLRQAFADLGDDVVALGEPSNPEEYVELWWGDAQFWQWSPHKVKARIAFTLSEAHSIITTGRERTIANLNYADRIICASHSATTAFKEAPIGVPIDVAMLGVHVSEIKYVERDWSGCLNFLHAGVTQFRKGSWLVPDAFLRAFNKNEDVSLTISSPSLSNMFVQLRSEYARHPGIIFDGDYRENPKEIYANHHIYVSPHLSEGFGLMIPEAMATGMACLVARCSAPLDFFDSDFGSWIEMSEQYLPVSQCLIGTAGFWRVPSLESLAQAMRLAYDQREDFQAKGKAAAIWVEKNLTWKHTAKTLKANINEVLHEKNISNSASLQRGNFATGPSGKYIAAC